MEEEARIARALRAEHRLLRQLMARMADWMASGVPSSALRERARMLFEALDDHAQFEEEALFIPMRRACEGCRGQLYRYRIAPASAARWLLLISDESEVVAGEIYGEGEARGIRTRQQMLVALIQDYIRHSIALAATVQGLGDQVRQLDPQARRWLAMVRRRLAQKSLS